VARYRNADGVPNLGHVQESIKSCFGRRYSIRTKVCRVCEFVLPCRMAFGSTQDELSDIERTAYGMIMRAKDGLSVKVLAERLAVKTYQARLIIARLRTLGMAGLSIRGMTGRLYTARG